MSDVVRSATCSAGGSVRVGAAHPVARSSSPKNWQRADGARNGSPSPWRSEWNKTRGYQTSYSTTREDQDATQEYVGIDLHRRHSVIVRRSAESETLEATRVDNLDLAAFERAVMAAGEHPEVVVEASYGWYWAVDWLQELGCNVHLAPSLTLPWSRLTTPNKLSSC